MKKTLFLNPPSYEGFDGGAGSRFQAKREVRSFWYPTWLAQVAALVPGSKLIDAPARGQSLDDILPLAGAYEMLVIYASAPTFSSDIMVAERFKAANPALMIGLVGAHVATVPEASLQASAALDFVARHEFDFTIREIAEGRSFDTVDGITWRRDGAVVHNKDRELIHDMDSLPSVIPVYARDLVVEDYYIGYLKHPYVSFYTGRGCRSKCSYCLWPQTIGGRVYRTQSPQRVFEDVKLLLELMPQTKEVFFDDDTFTDDLPRAEEVAKLLGPLLKAKGVTWSVNAKPNVPYATLKVLKDSNLRQLLVGYESGNQQILNNIRKGTRLDIIRRFTADCHKLGITVHGTFIVGLPGETKDTIQETIRFAKEINPHSLQVSLAAPYPGTELYQQALDNGWYAADGLVETHGNQTAVLNYPGLSSAEIFAAVEEFYRAFYFRPAKIAEMVGEMLTSWTMFKRRIREGIEFFQFLRKRGEPDSCGPAAAA
jgi:hopanoid biosynthesis associated radical SAM protein HpnJ